MDEKKAVPTIVLTIADRERFEGEIEIRDVPSLEYAMNMIETAKRQVTKMMADAEALEFGEKMNRAAQAQRGMGMPRIVKPQ